MVRLSFRAFFNPRPALPFPLPDFRLVTLQSASYRALATPSQLPQNPPGLRRMVADLAFALDQVSITRSVGSIALMLLLMADQSQ